MSTQKIQPDFKFIIRQTDLDRLALAISRHFTADPGAVFKPKRDGLEFLHPGSPISHKAVVSIDHGGTPWAQTVKNLRLGSDDACKTAQAFKMGQRGIGDEGGGWAGKS